MIKIIIIIGIITGFCSMNSVTAKKLPYPIVDTGQVRCYDNHTEIIFPEPGSSFYGQDAHYKGNLPKYNDNKNGSISDLVTGLMWQKSPEEKKSLKEALADASKCRIGGYKDWRMPTIKELYSLILFSGTDPDPRAQSTSGLKPFIDTNYFEFKYGDPDKDERVIDSQYASSTRYVSTTMHADETVFGVNFADGRIKGYGIKSPRTGNAKKFYVIYVRGNKVYGKNDYKVNKNGTITDRATGLTWMQKDSGQLKAGDKKNGGMTWARALKWAENLKYGGFSDWRLPNVKELQSIVDYTRSPKTTKSPAISFLFKLSQIKDEGGNKNYAHYWTSSSHISPYDGSKADYIAFGEALGWMYNRRSEEYILLDVHGAGCQRSDPKDGDPSEFPRGRGPQGDVIRIYNQVLCIRGGIARKVSSGPAIEMKDAPPGRNHGRRRRRK